MRGRAPHDLDSLVGPSTTTVHPLVELVVSLGDTDSVRLGSQAPAGSVLAPGGRHVVP